MTDQDRTDTSPVPDPTSTAAPPKPTWEVEREGGAISLGPLVVTFHRTLRIPEDGQSHKLPPSFGALPCKRVDDYADRVPPSWRAHGGVFLPLYQRESLWVGFVTRDGTYRAVKIAAGKINAVSGGVWDETLRKHDKNGDEAARKAAEAAAQDYMVVPTQPWIDGFNVGEGIVKQFTAMPLGQGYTVEGQVSGEETFGGIQLLVVPPKADGPAAKAAPTRRLTGAFASMGMGQSAGGEIALHAGGNADADYGTQVSDDGMISNYISGAFPASASGENLSLSTSASSGPTTTAAKSSPSSSGD